MGAEAAKTGWFLTREGGTTGQEEEEEELSLAKKAGLLSCDLGDQREKQREVKHHPLIAEEAIDIVPRGSVLYLLCFSLVVVLFEGIVNSEILLPIPYGKHYAWGPMYLDNESEV